MFTRTAGMGWIGAPMVGREIWMADQCTLEQARAQQGEAKVQPFIAVSREPGAGAEVVCGMLAERLNLRFVGRPLLEQIALALHTTPDRLEQLEESPPSVMDEILFNLLEPQSPSMEAYAMRLGRAVYSAACLYPTVFMGGMAHLYLPRLQGVCVRLVASPSERIAHVMKIKGYDEARARHWIADTEMRRRNFAQRFFHKDIEAPEHYDLILDSSRLGAERCAALVATAFQEFQRAPAHRD